MLTTRIVLVIVLTLGSLLSQESGQWWAGGARICPVSGAVAQPSLTYSWPRVLSVATAELSASVENCWPEPRPAWPCDTSCSLTNSCTATSALSMELLGPGMGTLTSASRLVLSLLPSIIWIFSVSCQRMIWIGNICSTEIMKSLPISFNEL